MPLIRGSAALFRILPSVVLSVVLGCESPNLQPKRNAQLTSVKLPALYQLDGFLIVADNPSLRHVELPSLTRVAGDLQITGNTSLSACDAQALASRLSTQPDHIDLTGNAGTCP